MSLFLKWLSLGFICFVSFFGSSGNAHADGGPLKLTVAMGYNEVEPVDRTFRVHAGFPRTFYVVVTNTSSSSQPIYGLSSDTGYSSISFEIRDEEGNSNVIRRKKYSNASSAVTSTLMNPGERKVFDIVLNEQEWENAFKLYKKGSRKAKVRAIYDNDSRMIYSEYYDVIVVDSGGTSGKQAEPKEARSTVLVSK